MKPAIRPGRAPGAGPGNFPRAVLAAVATAVTASAQAAPPAPPPPQQQPLLITGATLHPVSGAAIAGGHLLIEQGRIKAIGTAAEVAPPPGAQVLHLPGKHVYPGFISANSALGLVEVPSVRGTVDTAETGPLNPGARTVVAINADSEQIPVARVNGVLAALAVPRSASGGLITGTSALIQLDGWNWEDMTVVPAVGMHVTLPSLRLNREVFPPPLDRRIEDFRRLSAQRIRALEEAFEAAGAYRRARASGEAITPDSRWEAMLPVLEGRLPVFMRADELAQIRYALGFAERMGVKLVIVGGADAWRIAEVLRDRRVPVVIAGVHRLPLRRDEDHDAPFRLAARLSSAGVTYCIAREGTEFGAASERNLAYEAATAAAHGLPRDEALRAITLYPARILGVADRLGSLEAGRLASLFVADGDPLEATTRIERIFVKGRELDMTTRHTQLRDRYEVRLRQVSPPRGR